MGRETIVIANDHAAVELKKAVMSRFTQFEWRDLGTTSTDSVDYPDYAAAAADLIAQGQAHRAVLICGSGIGMCIAANKFPGIRAAVVESVETAILSRDHNDSNVLCLGARTLKEDRAFEIIEAWLKTSFSESPRHKVRLQKIASFEKKR